MLKFNMSCFVYGFCVHSETGHLQHLSHHVIFFACMWAPQTCCCKLFSFYAKFSTVHISFSSKIVKVQLVGNLWADLPHMNP